MECLPGECLVNLGKAAFPGTETGAVHGLATTGGAGLGMMAEFMMEHMFDKEPSHPGARQTRRETHRRMRVTEIDTEAQALELTGPRIAPPTKEGARQVGKETRVDSPETGLVIKAGTDPRQGAQLSNAGRVAGPGLSRQGLHRQMKVWVVALAAFANETLQIGHDRHLIDVLDEVLMNTEHWGSLSLVTQ